MSPPCLCCPSPWMPPAAPAPACIRQGSNIPPFTFPAAIAILQTSIIPSSLSSPGISVSPGRAPSPPWFQLPFLVPAVLELFSSRYQKNPALFITDAVWGRVLPVLMDNHTQLKNLAAGQSSQMLLLQISSAPCSFNKGKNLAWAAAVKESDKDIGWVWFCASSRPC